MSQLRSDEDVARDAQRVSELLNTVIKEVFDRGLVTSVSLSYVNHPGGKVRPVLRVNTQKEVK